LAVTGGVYWLASYPKSGNTWIRFALRAMETGGEPVRFDESARWQPDFRLWRTRSSASTREVLDDALNLDSSVLTHDEIERLRPRAVAAWAGEDPARVVKVHDAWRRNEGGEPLFPPELTAGVVYVARDPRDVAVSFADHRGISIDAAIAMMADPATTLAASGPALQRHVPQRLSSWSGHVESWLGSPCPRRLLIRYEDMAADPATQLERIAAFIDLPASSETIARAVAATRFDAMRAEEERVGFEERSASSRRFFRRGIVGGWRDTLSAGQARAIVETHRAVMIRLGYAVD
jgi:aryl sulfotransferase